MYRDSERVTPLFDERDEAVKWMCAALIEKAHKAGRKVGICGQAPSDYPEFATFLVERSIAAHAHCPVLVVRDPEGAEGLQARLREHDGSAQS